MSHEKCRNYWKYLKGKLSKDGIQLVSVTNHFKFEAPDGKQRAADALDAECVQTLAKHYPNNRANAFLDWFVYSDNTITVAYLAIIDEPVQVTGQDDAANAEWFPLSALPELAFDHAEIIRDAVKTYMTQVVSQGL